MKISVIVPAYNADKFLEKCIASFAAQDLPAEQYEVIVVNDGSTDSTAEVLESLSSRYSFLRTITTPNSGLSASRNRGVRAAQGDYLLFVDADDSIQPNMFKGIDYQMTSGQLDMLLMNYRLVFSDGRIGESGYRITENNEQIVSGREFLLRDKFPSMVWAFVYRRVFFEACGLEFPLIFHEDEGFTPQAICRAKRIKYLPVVYYNYFQHSVSFMHTYKEKNFYDMISAMALLDRFKDSIEDDKQVCRYLEARIANRLLMTFKRSIRDGYSIQKPIVEKICAEKLYPLKPHTFSIYALLFNSSPTLFERFYRFLKRK